MKRTLAPALLIVATSVMSGCASSSAGVDTSELARLVGNAHSVKLDAQLLGTQLRAGFNIGIRFEVENMRPDPIIFADITPEVSFDPETGVITVLLGSEVPGNELLPRMELVRSGEKRVFNVGVNLRAGSRRVGGPRLIRARLAWIEQIEPFQELIDMEQKAWHNPDLANALFQPWVENLRFVTTNEVPLDWYRRNPLPGATERRRGM